MELYTVRISGLWRYYIYIAEILKASSLTRLTHVPLLSSTKVASKARNICFSTHHFTFTAVLFPKDFGFDLYCAKSECHLVSSSPPLCGQLNFFSSQPKVCNKNVIFYLKLVPWTKTWFLLLLQCFIGFVQCGVDVATIHVFNFLCFNFHYYYYTSVKPS